MCIPLNLDKFSTTLLVMDEDERNIGRLSAQHIHLSTHLTVESGA